MRAPVGPPSCSQESPTTALSRLVAPLILGVGLILGSKEGSEVSAAPVEPPVAGSAAPLAALAVPRVVATTHGRATSQEPVKVQEPEQPATTDPSVGILYDAARSLFGKVLVLGAGAVLGGAFGVASFDRRIVERNGKMRSLIADFSGRAGCQINPKSEQSLGNTGFRNVGEFMRNVAIIAAFRELAHSNSGIDFNGKENVFQRSGAVLETSGFLLQSCLYRSAVTSSLTACGASLLAFGEPYLLLSTVAGFVINMAVPVLGTALFRWQVNKVSRRCLDDLNEQLAAKSSAPDRS